MSYKLLDANGLELDFFSEMSKYAGFLRTSHVSRHLAIYELYKKTINLPGSVVEFGIYNGSTFFFLARLVEIFNAAEHEVHHSASRHLFGFDRFSGFKEISDKDKTIFPEPSVKRVGGLKSDTTSFQHTLELLKTESKISHRIHVINGDIEDTYPKFLTDYSGVRICLAFVDFDLYKPTKIVLDHIFELMVPGGIIVFDEYSFPDWPGETKAVDEFTSRYGLKMYSIPWTFGSQHNKTHLIALF